MSTLKPTMTRLNCIGVNSNDFPDEFIESLRGTAEEVMERTHLLVRVMVDDHPNVVINTDDAAHHLEKEHPYVAEWFRSIERTVQYVFISIDF